MLPNTEQSRIFRDKLKLRVAKAAMPRMIQFVFRKFVADDTVKTKIVATTTTSNFHRHHKTHKERKAALTHLPSLALFFLAS